MKTKIVILSVFLATLVAQDSKPTDPITDRLRYEIAAAQRDYYVAERQMQQALTLIRAKVSQAEKACGQQAFNPQSLNCEGKRN